MSFLPICEISPYARKGWTIKARLTSRAAAPREVKKKDGRNGKVLSFELLDKHGGEIRASLWDDAVSKFNEYLKPGRVYTFSGGVARVANRNFTTCRHNYELSFFEDAKVVMVENDDSIGAVQFKNLRSLRELATMNVPASVNVCGLLIGVKEAHLKTTKTGEVLAREITIVDQSECTIEVMLWGDAAQKPGMEEGHVVILKGMRVGDYSGRNGAMLDGANIFVEPEALEVQPLKDWYAENKNLTFRALSSGERKNGDGGLRKTGDLAQLSAEVGTLAEGQTVYWNCKAYMAYVRTQNKEKVPLPIWYAACPKCMRKIDSQGHCLKCDVRVPKPDLRFLISSLIVEDDGSQMWVGTFDEGAKLLLSTTAEQLSSSFEDDDLNVKLGKVQKMLQKKYFAEQFDLSLRSKVEVYNGVMRPKTQIVRANKVDYKADAAAMLKELAAGVVGASEDVQAEVAAMLGDADWQSHWAGLPSVEKEMQALSQVAVA
jgi:replication factor A1